MLFCPYLRSLSINVKWASVSGVMNSNSPDTDKEWRRGEEGRATMANVTGGAMVAVILVV